METNVTMTNDSHCYKEWTHSTQKECEILRKLVSIILIFNYKNWIEWSRSWFFLLLEHVFKIYFFNQKHFKITIIRFDFRKVTILNLNRTSTVLWLSRHDSVLYNYYWIAANIFVRKVKHLDECLVELPHHKNVHYVM